MNKLGRPRKYPLIDLTKFQLKEAAKELNEVLKLDPPINILAAPNQLIKQIKDHIDREIKPNDNFTNMTGDVLNFLADEKENVENKKKSYYATRPRLIAVAKELNDIMGLKPQIDYVAMSYSKLYATIKVASCEITEDDEFSEKTMALLQSQNWIMPYQVYKQPNIIKESTMTIVDFGKMAAERGSYPRRYSNEEIEKMKSAIRVAKRKSGKSKDGKVRYSIYISIGEKVTKTAGWIKGDRVNVLVDTRTNLWTLVRTSAGGSTGGSWALTKNNKRLATSLVLYEGTVNLPTALIAYENDIDISGRQIDFRPQPE